MVSCIFSARHHSPRKASQAAFLSLKSKQHLAPLALCQFSRKLDETLQLQDSCIKVKYIKEIHPGQLKKSQCLRSADRNQL